MKKIINIIILIFILLLLSLALLFYYNINKEYTYTGTIITKDKNYIIVKVNKEDYLLNTTKDYNIGDKIEFTIKNINNKDTIKTGKLLDIELINPYIEEDIDEVNTTTKEENTSKDYTTNKDNTNINTNSNEEDIIKYFNDLETSLVNYQEEDTTLGDKLKKNFITIIDFLFYEGTIKGKKFQELSNEAKIKVLALSISIDDKIEKYFPSYKEEISTSTKDIYLKSKAKILELYLEITTEICSNEEEFCNTAKEGLSTLKENFKLTWELLKDITGSSITKLKEWYELWRQV